MTEITIFHTSDLHNHLYINKILKILEKETNYMLFDSGDALKGSNTLFFKNETIIDKMNKLKYTAMCMGNREFNYLRNVLKNRLKSFKFPVLVGNLIDLKNKIKFINYIIINNFFIFGLTNPQYKENHFYEKIFKFKFINIDKAIKTLIKLTSEKNIIILLSHLGIKRDIEIAKKFTDIAIILGGHSHSITKDIVKINNTYIIHSGAYCQYIHKIKLKIKSGKIINLNKELISLI